MMTETNRAVKAHKTWPKPKSRDVGSYGNLELYAETLKVAENERAITVATLKSDERGLGSRIRGRLLVKQLTTTTANDLVVELQGYGWLKKVGGTPTAYRLTDEGEEAVILARDDTHRFRRMLLGKMQERFVIPAWFVHRLYEINPCGGDVLLPAPQKDWRPDSRKLNDDKWTIELTTEAKASFIHNSRVLPDAFPVPIETWLPYVEKCWREVEITRSKSKRYGPRKRLATSMRRASIELLFNNVPFGKQNEEFPTAQHPIPPRSFQSWCPLLDALELIVYTDSKPEIRGRLIFPCSTFAELSSDQDFEPAQNVRSPLGEQLLLHQPTWGPEFRSEFESTLWSVYSGIARHTGTRYISLQDVRDEACRLLRISSLCFETCLKNTVRDLIRNLDKKSPHLMISLESDLQGGGQLLRRPVFVDGIPHSLISISSV